MRILNLVQRYAPAHGGAERHMAAIASRQAAAGHDVTVLTTDALDFELFWQPGLARLSAGETVIDGVRVLRFPVRHLPGTPRSYDAIRRTLWLLSRLPDTIALAHLLARLTPRVPDLRAWLASTNEAYDLVVAANICYETFLAAGAEFATRRDLPLILHPFTHLGAGSKPGSDAISQFYTMGHQVALVRSASASVMMTPAERDYYVNQGVASERLPIVGSGVEPADVLGGDGARGRAALATDAPIVLMLGNLSPDKGATQTIEAVRRLWAEGHSVQLALAGAKTVALDAYLASLPAADRARLAVLGRVEDQTRRDLLAACDLLVMPSRADSFGIVYLEAWLYGKPVIGADAWGIRDGIIRHGMDGLLVPFGDTTGLAAAITTLLNEPQMAASMGRHGREKVLRDHTWTRKMEAIEALYRSVSQCR